MEVYNEQYYHSGCGPIPYEEPEHWVEFFGMIADHIVADFAPKTVLDAGCAMGYLVAALRDRGVEAYGIDISRYAISKVREDIKPFCVVGSLLDELPSELPRHYDLVTNIEVLEHLYAEDGVVAIKNICATTDTVIFSSTPDDFTEATHLNVQQREYWARLFAQCGFFDDITYRPKYLTSHAICFRRQDDFLRQVEDYERVIARYENLYALKNEKWISKIYFDTGDGISEKFSASFEAAMGTRFLQRITLPCGCKAIRFDPVEGTGCLVWDIKAKTENKFVQIKKSNGTMLGDVLACAPNAPQIFFEDFEQEHQYLELSAEIMPLDWDGWMRFCGYLEETIVEKEQLEENVRRKESKIASLKNEVLALQQENAARNAEIQDYSNLVAYERQEAAKTVGAYQAIANSTFWKMTKPGRVLVEILKKFVFRPTKKIFSSLATFGLRETLRKVKRKLIGQSQPQIRSVLPTSAVALVDRRRNSVTNNPVDGIETVFVDDKVKRLNLVTDTIDASSLLGGVATALIVATEFANRCDYELRIITRKTETNPANYEKIMRISGVQPAKKLSFYSDYERFNKPQDFRMEISSGDIFFATSWWSAQAIKNTTINPRFFYIIQEVETFFYNYGGERLMCEQIMRDSNINFIVNSHYLYDYFKENYPNITDCGCYFEPAFPTELYNKKVFEDKKKYKLFFYARPNNPRNLYDVGVELLQKAVDRGILDMREWDIYCVGQNAPVIHFSAGKDSINMGQLSWTEYAKFLADVDLGLCLMYTPHPSYPPFDVASAGGVVLTNKMLNKQSFEMCRNVIMADLEENSFMHEFEKAVALAKNKELRKANYKSNTIPHSWHSVLNDTITFMREMCKDV